MRDPAFPDASGFQYVCFCLFLGAWVVMPCFWVIRGCVTVQDSWEEDKARFERTTDYKPAEGPLED